MRISDLKDCRAICNLILVAETKPEFEFRIRNSLAYSALNFVFRATILSVPFAALGFALFIALQEYERDEQTKMDRSTFR